MFVENLRKCLRIFPAVYVSSEDKKILKLAEREGAIGILRPEELLGDVPNINVYRHAFDYMPDAYAFVAVQANSPNVSPKVIEWCKKLIERGHEEVITCHEDESIYGSVWAMTKGRLYDYKDFYNPKPDVMIIDDSVDIHNLIDYNLALRRSL